MYIGGGEDLNNWVVSNTIVILILVFEDFELHQNFDGNQLFPV